MADKQETVADIVAEMRNFACELKGNLGPKSNWIERTDRADDLLLFADRFEAAANREEADALFTGAFCEAKRKGGNAAKLREALENIHRFVNEWIAAGVIDNSMAKSILVNCDAAIAAPARNCDRFATAEDAYKAFSSYCFNRPSEGKCVGCPIVGEGGKSNCFGAWLMAAAQEGGGHADA